MAQTIGNRVFFRSRLLSIFCRFLGSLLGGMGAPLSLTYFLLPIVVLAGLGRFGGDLGAKTNARGGPSVPPRAFAVAPLLFGWFVRARRAGWPMAVLIVTEPGGSVAVAPPS